jgi:hypothetical protein
MTRVAEGPVRTARLVGDAAALAVLALAAGCCAWVASAPPVVGWFTDALQYLIYADFFTADPPAYARAMFAESRFPPGFPLWLSVFGAGLDAPQRALYASLAAWWLACLVSWAWYRAVLPGVAWAAVALVGWMATAGALTLWLDPLSESLFLAILLASAWASTSARLGPLLVPALVGILPLVRSAGAACVIAALVWLWTRPAGSVRRPWLGVALLLVPGLAWAVFRTLSPVRGAYGEVLPRMLDVFGDPATLSGSLVHALASASLLVTGPHAGVLGWILVPVGLLCVVGLARRLRELRFDALVVAAYLPLAVVWPYPAETERLLLVMLPLVPVLVAAALDGLRGPTARLFGAMAAVSWLLAAGPGLLLISHRAVLPLDPELEQSRRTTAYMRAADDRDAIHAAEVLTRFMHVVEALPSTVPSGACVATVYHELVWAYGRRAVATQPLPAQASAAAASSIAGCDYVLTWALPTDTAPPLHPFDGGLAAWEVVMMSAGTTAYPEVPAVILARRPP